MTKVPVLDHGFVEVLNIAGPSGAGSDRDPANAARMSFDDFSNAERTPDMDGKLCEYLMRNKHTTPFEMVELWIEMKLPIFVARQFVRHRTVSINEVSARYVKLPAEWYIPQPEVVGFKPKKAKQGRTIVPWDELTDSEKETIHQFRRDLDQTCRESYLMYEDYLEAGIAPELARSFLHLNHYTHWLWKQDMHNIMHFLSLRDHSHAQFESQQYAKALTSVLRAHLPLTMGLYDKYRRLPE